MTRIDDAYRRLVDPEGTLGPQRSTEVTEADGWAWVEYERGAIFAPPEPSRPAAVLSGSVWEELLRRGWSPPSARPYRADGSGLGLGWPDASAVRGDDGTLEQDFERGHIWIWPDGRTALLFADLYLFWEQVLPERPRLLLGRLVRDLEQRSGTEAFATFENGWRIRRLIRSDRFSVLTYNVALLPDFPICLSPVPGATFCWTLISQYKGRDRNLARERIGELVRASGADVVGLTEAYELDTGGIVTPISDRRIIVSAAGDVYSFAADIASDWVPTEHLSQKALSYLRTDSDSPIGLGPPFLEAVPRPSELLMLSRHPISTEVLVYRAGFGADELAAKGAVHSRVVTRSGIELDIFLTHLQNNNETDLDGSKTKALAANRLQTRQLASFIRQQRRKHVIGWRGDIPPPPPRWFEVRPALVIGDFNNPAPWGPAENPSLTAAFGLSDLWVETGTAPRHANEGITSDHFRAFEPEKTPLPLRSKRRHRKGGRIDYMLAGRGSYPWNDLRPARVVVPRWGRTRIRTWELVEASGVDLSDHYGLLTTLAETRIYLVESTLSPPPPAGTTTPA
jgi:endonuclease/exonuclease/phosphatase family metal-dependent hydrolase